MLKYHFWAPAHLIMTRFRASSAPPLWYALPTHPPHPLCNSRISLTIACAHTFLSGRESRLGGVRNCTRSPISNRPRRLRDPCAFPLLFQGSKIRCVSESRAGVSRLFLFFARSIRLISFDRFRIRANLAPLEFSDTLPCAL